jgi:hypothetical protein
MWRRVGYSGGFYEKLNEMYLFIQASIKFISSLDIFKNFYFKTNSF